MSVKYRTVGYPAPLSRHLHTRCKFGASQRTMVLPPRRHCREVPPWMSGPKPKSPPTTAPDVAGGSGCAPVASPGRGAPTRRKPSERPTARPHRRRQRHESPANGAGHADAVVDRRTRSANAQRCRPLTTQVRGRHRADGGATRTSLRRRRGHELPGGVRHRGLDRGLRDEQAERRPVRPGPAHISHSGRGDADHRDADVDEQALYGRYAARGSWHPSWRTRGQRRERGPALGWGKRSWAPPGRLRFWNHPPQWTVRTRRMRRSRSRV